MKYGQKVDGGDIEGGLPAVQRAGTIIKILI
jgi:hypothetical protein